MILSYNRIIDSKKKVIKSKILKLSISEIKTMVDKHYKSLLRDVIKLADVDGYSHHANNHHGGMSFII
ncbi:alpha-1,6-fucosyltransferase [Aphis craccivora]|uniref:Alpha-1,6-fucosyltransferase n=1 Tax=Aphis craccivora TaxID=307492 RepID=A0A6G0Y892_APHCR|nr:alpha-1,6-fucosyltransferase [Aphis craccivora]